MASVSACRPAAACTKPQQPATAAAAAARCRPLRRPRQQQPARRPTRCSAASDGAGLGFHQSLLVATERPAALPPLPGPVQVREAEDDEELQAAAWLRAFSFYRYPEERKFAAEVRCWAGALPAGCARQFALSTLATAAAAAAAAAAAGCWRLPCTPTHLLTCRATPVPAPANPPP